MSEPDGSARLPGGVGALFARLRNRQDSEHEQAAVRLILGSLMVAYVVATYPEGVTAVTRTAVLWICGGFLTASALLFVAILIYPGVSPLRRYVGIVHDMSAITTGMALTGETGVPLLAVYLWVILGNGFRFGTRYLVVASVLSIGGLLGVFLTSAFWSRHPMFSASFLVVLVLIPGYAAVLITKLNDAIRRANEANKAKSQFLAKMSHELRTPLNGVIGMADLLLDSGLEPRHEGHARTIRDSAHTLLGIIENILDFSKIEAGRIAVESVDFDLHQLTSDTLQIFRSQAMRQGLGLYLRVDPHVPFRLRGDPLHLRQILTNLLGNAVKFTEKGWIELRVTLSPDSGSVAAPVIRFAVEDTGVGIAEKDQTHIFESFRQATSSTARRYGGTGLGTTIARELTTLLGGRIGFESRFGQGSTFWFEVPVLAHEQAREPEPGTVEAGPVLVVGDRSRVASLCEQLRTWRVEHVAVDTAIGAFNALQQEHDRGPRYAVVLVSAPGIDFDAREFAVTLRTERALDEVEVVLIDVPADTELDGRWRESGFSAVLAAPLDKTLLFNSLHVARGSGEMADNVISLSEHYKRLGASAARGLHILVADDNETNRKVLEGILERVGHRVTLVGDGEAALDALTAEAADFDLLIFDKNMPGRSGIDAFKAYRFMVPPEELVPGIILTADATQEAIDACQEAGVDAYLTKPVDSLKLLETVARLSASVQPLKRPRVQAVKPESGSPGRNSVLVDEDKLASLLEIGGGGGFFGEVVAGFLRDSERAIEAMAAALAEEDYPKLRETIHALRGSGGEIGANGLVALCMELRKLKPFELDSDEARGILKRLRETHARTEELLSAFARRQADEVEPR